MKAHGGLDVGGGTDYRGVGIGVGNVVGPGIDAELGSEPHVQVAPCCKQCHGFRAVVATVLLFATLALCAMNPSMLRFSGSNSGRGPVTWVTVAMYTLPMALASGIGGLPFFCFPKLSHYWEGVATAVAAGVMLAVSFDLLDGMYCAEGTSASQQLQALLGLGMGAPFIVQSERWLEQYEQRHGSVGTGTMSLGRLQGLGARKAALFVIVMTLHSCAEGGGVGIAWSEGGHGGGAKAGLLVTLAIGIHNVPEGLAVALVMVSRGQSAALACGMAVVSSLGQPLTAVPAFLFVERFQLLQPCGMGFAAGCMVYITLADLLPDALDKLSRREVASVTICSVGAMLACKIVFGLLVT